MVGLSVLKIVLDFGWACASKRTFAKGRNRPEAAADVGICLEPA